MIIQYNYSVIIFGIPHLVQGGSYIFVKDRITHLSFGSHDPFGQEPCT